MSLLVSRVDHLNRPYIPMGDTIRGNKTISGNGPSRTTASLQTPQSTEPSYPSLLQRPGPEYVCLDTWVAPLIDQDKSMVVQVAMRSQASSLEAELEWVLKVRGTTLEGFSNTMLKITFRLAKEVPCNGVDKSVPMTQHNETPQI